jgi:hypothetical protein
MKAVEDLANQYHGRQIPDEFKQFHRDASILRGRIAKAQIKE